MLENLDHKSHQIESIKRRLKRIEGQLKGIERMIDQDSCCMDILVQISAVRAAISKVGLLLVDNHIKGCLIKTLEGENKEKTLDDLMNVLSNYIK